MTIAMIAFDLDGVIADTEPLHKRAKERILEELGCGGTVDVDAFVGLPNGELWNGVIARCHLRENARELERRQYDYILEQMHRNHTRVSDGLTELLDYLARHGQGAGLYSSSDRYYVDRVLEFFGITARFSPIFGGDQVGRKKPAPDGYRKLMEAAALPPERIVALEDSTAGVTAATAAGLLCIGYINPTSGRQNLEKAFLRVRDLCEVTQWLGRQEIG